MKKEKIAEFTRKISQSNRSELIVVIYDVYFVCLSDARDFYQNKNWDDFKESVRHAQRAIDELIDVLDFSYELAGNLYRIYMFCKDMLAKAIYARQLTEIETAERLMRKLYESFVQVARQDQSKPLMQNAQQVYAGFTYGRDELTETCQDFTNNRGFLV